MKTFAERLKIAIIKRGLSQAEAARLCGMAQQSFNYIIANNLNSSKLAPQIAAALDISAEWLILGRGKFEENKIYEFPIIHSSYMLKKFIKNELDENTLEYTVTNSNLGVGFAYLLEAKKMVICSTQPLKMQIQKPEFLTLQESGITVTNKKEGNKSFPIFEWRIRSVEF